MNNILNLDYVKKGSVSIKDIKAYRDKESKNWFLAISYLYTDIDGVPKELEIPKIPFPLSDCTLPFLWGDDSMSVIRGYDNLDTVPVIDFIPHVSLKLGYFHNINGDIDKTNPCYFAVKDLRKNMTKADIEKALGYKINIIEE